MPNFEEADPQNIVLLMAKAPQVELAALAASFSRAAGRLVRPVVPESVEAVEEGWLPEGDAVLDTPPNYLAHVNGVLYVVNVIEDTFFDDEQVEELLRKHDHPREQEAIRKHRAWVAVEFLNDEDATEENYTVAARVAAEWAGADCLALIHPASQTLVAAGARTAEALRGPKPMEAVFGVSEFLSGGNLLCVESDPRLVAAKDEARRRFPEFAQAFAAGDGENFSVKTCLAADEGTEHIWVLVEAIGGEEIEGRLANDPAYLEMQLGDRVKVGVAAVEDWGYERRDGGLEGFLSSAVLRLIQAERQAD